MANKTDTTVQGTLQRGKACLRCRKRKMRCDGAKPACQQCTRAKKAEGCEYDDGKGKTRTQILKETITRLEQRIRELEDPDYVPPVVTLHDPHGHGYHRSESSSSSLGSPGSTTLSGTHSPFASESYTHSPHDSWSQLPTISPSPAPFTPDLFYEEPTPHIQLSSFELGPVLLDIFAPHRHQVGLQVHMGHLRDSLTRTHSEQRHPVLMNAIYLWACFISRPEPLCQHEEQFLAQALDAHRDALRMSDKIVDIIQASCLLSLYFLVNGRMVEGSYHLSAALSLAVQCNLGKPVSHEVASWLSDPLSNFDSKPPKNDYLEGERILAFWQVYNLDRCWSVALRKAPIIPDGPDLWRTIDCPWPQDMADYEAGHFNASSNISTIRSFLDGEFSPSGFSTQALRVKASALFSQADQLSSRWEPTLDLTGGLQEEIQSLEVTITRFLQTLIPVQQLDASMVEDRHTMIVTHTLAHSAIIRLYDRLSQNDHVAYDKCSRAARACASIVKHISDPDFDFLDPIMGPCWTSASKILILNLRTMVATWPLMNSDDIRNDLGTIHYAMTTLNRRFPVLGLCASQLQKELSTC